MGLLWAEHRVGGQRQKRLVLAPRPHPAKISARLSFRRPHDEEAARGDWYVHGRGGSSVFLPWRASRSRRENTDLAVGAEAAMYNVRAAPRR